MKRDFKWLAGWLFVGLAALYLAARVLSFPYLTQDGVPYNGGDARPLYYGTWLLWRGVNPYPDRHLVEAWQTSGAPERFRPGGATAPFIYPPSLAVLLFPAALLPWEYGIPFVGQWNLLALFVCAFLFYRWAPAYWPRTTRCLFLLFALLMPPVIRVLFYGQSTLLILALMLGGYFALRRGKEGLAGVLIGLSLTKFTLSLPLLALLAFRRGRRAAFLALGLFGALTVALLLPAGVGQGIADYRAAIAATTAQGMANDAGSRRYDTHSMTNFERLSILLRGSEDAAAQRLTAALSLAVLCVGGWFLWKARQVPAFDHPLDLPLATLVALTLFYHRYYDLAALMLVAYGLLDYRLRWPDRWRWPWWLAAGTLFLLAFCTGGTGLGRVANAVLFRFGLPDFGNFTCVLTALLLAQLFWLYALDRRDEGPMKPEAARLTPPAPV